jgi:hypothetical protein
MSASLLFLAPFLAVAGLLFGCWSWISPLYMESILPAVNALFTVVALPVQLELHETALVFAYERSAGSMLRLQMHSYEAVYFNIIPAVALLATVSHKRIAWRLGWIGLAVLLLFGTHVASFFVSAHIALWDYVHSLAPTRFRGDLIVGLGAWFPTEQYALYSSALAQWNIWGRYAFVLGIWFFALRQEIVLWARDMADKQVAFPTEKLYHWRHKSLKKQESVPNNIKVKRAV